MGRVAAKLNYNPETMECCLTLPTYHPNKEGLMTNYIPSNNLGLIKDDQHMDLPIIYYNLTPYFVKNNKNKGNKCYIDLDEVGRIKEIEGKVIITF